MESEYKPIKAGDKRIWIYFFRQALVVILLCGYYIISGFTFGTPTVAVPQFIRDANSTAAVGIEMATWLVSSPGYSGAIAIFIVIPLTYFVGRKWTMGILSVNTLIASAIIYFSKTPGQLLISQILSGPTIAADYSIFYIILTEYSSPQYRGVFLTFKSATFFWGIWIANAIGIFSHYNYVGLFGILCSINSLIICLFLPESPYWLASKGRYDKCVTAHRWLKGVSEDAENELDLLISSQKKNVSIDSSNSLKKLFCTHFTAIKQPNIYKPLLLCFLVISIYSLSGKLVCSLYAIEMMKKITKDKSSVYIGVLILDGVTVFAMYVGCVLSKILKRRILLLTTAITGTIVLFAMCINLYLIKFSVLSENDYIIITMLVVYSLAIGCGPAILSTSISAELLPITFKHFSVVIFAFSFLLFASTILKTAPYIFNMIGFEGVYLMFGIFSIFTLTLFYNFVPETKDRTLHEIEDYFKAKEKTQTSSKLLALK